MTTFAGGMTPVQFYSGLNIVNSNQKFTSIIGYGAVGDDSTDNTTAIQNCINAVAVTGGWVFVPPGIYKTHTLTLPFNVGIIGDLYSDRTTVTIPSGSVLKSIAAEPLISCLYVKPIRSLGVSHITLDGAATGTIGITSRLIVGFVYDSVFVHDFTQRGFSLNGCLCGTIKDSWFHHSPIQIHFELLDDLGGTGFYMAPNFVKIMNCTIAYHPTWGIYYTGGLMLEVIGTNIESGGTNGNAATGCIYYKGNSGVANQSHIGLIMRDCWIENHYGTLISLPEPTNTVRQLSIIDNLMSVKEVTPEVEINIVGANTINHVIVRSSCLQNTASLISNGANASIVNDNSVIAGTITKSNSGTYYTVDTTSA